MIAVTKTPGQDRRRHQQRVAALLEQIEERRLRLHVLLVSGAKPAGVRDQKAELRALRSELAAAVG